MDVLISRIFDVAEDVQRGAILTVVRRLEMAAGNCPVRV